LHDQLHFDIERKGVGEITLTALVRGEFNPKGVIPDKGNFAVFFGEAAVIEKALFVEFRLRAIFAHRKAKRVVNVLQAEVSNVILDGENLKEDLLKTLLLVIARALTGLEKPFERFELYVNQIRNVSKSSFIRHQDPLDSRLLGCHILPCSLTIK